MCTHITKERRTKPKLRGIKRLLALQVRQRHDHCRARNAGNPLHVRLGHTPDRHCANVHKVLEARVVNALGREDNVGACFQDLLDPLLGDVRLARADGLGTDKKSQTAARTHTHTHTSHTNDAVRYEHDEMVAKNTTGISPPR